MLDGSADSPHKDPCRDRDDGGKETNRLNRERCASGEADRKELADIEKKMATMISVIEDGGYVKA